MYAQLGDIIFEGLKGFSDFSSRKTASIAQHAVIDGKPRLQKTGDMLDQVTLGMQFHASFCVPEDEIAKLDSALRSGSIMPLITGKGESIGNFVIAERAMGIQHMFPNGAIRSATVSVTLLESEASDVLGEALLQAKRTAFSNGSNSPAVVPYNETLTSAGLKAGRSLSDAGSLQSVGTQQLNLASSSPDVRAHELNKAKTTFQKVNSAIVDFEDQFSKVQSVVSNADEIKNQAQTAKTYTQNILTAISAGDVAGAVSANRDLRNGLLDLNSSSARLITLTAIRRI